MNKYLFAASLFPGARACSDDDTSIRNESVSVAARGMVLCSKWPGSDSV